MICSKTINNKCFSLHSVLIFIHSETQHSKEQMKESISLSDSLPSVHVPVGYRSFASRQCACGREKKTSWGVSDGEQEMRRTEGFATERLHKSQKDGPLLLLKPPFSHLEV